jgi:uncharacterized protein YdeI (YjbR/CyaY-like superfamily)
MELRNLLNENYHSDQSIWLVTHKKFVPEKYVSRDEVLDELLCFGWIDSVRRKLDSDKTMQLISPRKSQYWSQTYKTRAARLIHGGYMHPSGLSSIELSKNAGLWNFMDDVDRLIIPADLTSTLHKYHGAYAFFNALNDSSIRFTLRWIKLAKTDETRRKRIEKAAYLASKGEKISES